MNTLEKKLAPSSALPVYQDKWVQVIGIPVITLFAQYLTYNNIQLNWMLAYELCSDAFKIFLIWQVFLFLLRYLDKRLSWQEHFVLRLVIQVGLSCFVCSLALTFLVWLEYALFRPYPNENFFQFDLVIANIFILFINAVYVGLYFYGAFQSKREKEQENPISASPLEASEVRPQAESYLVKSGKKEFLIPFEEILGIYSEEKETYLVSSEGKLFVLESSLDKVMQQLPHPYFFRANRKFILSRQAVAMFQAETNGKVLASLKPSPKLPDQIMVSKDRAPAFRQWLKENHSSLK
ncbi:LytR/AlgR family response regulator transcription factor [Sabulibacter ruber]|uniref:LytR/AlgR family response regulator transcription factor n=1 Tax=Sabulibacter ruber TaxID=2811901 RepID=UPI001A97BA91|nr:LytTR family DNA-binding domain-containing protein [Sabulibacter ruber]